MIGSKTSTLGTLICGKSDVNIIGCVGEFRVNLTVISTLIGGHAALALAAGLFPIFLPVSDSVDDIPAAILALSQMSLLSLWIGFGNSHWLLRVGTVAGAGICLATLVLCADEGGWPMSSGIEWFVLCIVLAPVPCVAIPSVFVRTRWAQVIRSNGPLCAGNGSFRFSLAHILQWTAILSVLLAFSRFLAGLSAVFGQLALMATLVVLFGFICGSVSLASLWASFSCGRPTYRVVAVTTLAASLGFIAGYALNGRETVIAWFFFSGIFTVMALIVIVSLLFLRVAGYRLCTLQEAGES